MARLLTRTRTRLAVKRAATKQKSRFQTQKRTHVAGVISGGLAVVDGQLYGTGADSAGVIDVVNLGRAAAALYVPENGSGSVTLAGGSGGCSSSGSGGIGEHELDGPYHTGTLARSQAPWAALDDDLQAHIADDIHHERLHNILNTDDHEVTAARYSVLGTPNAANTLGMWLTDEDGTPGNVLLRSDDYGAARLNALFAHDRVQSETHYWGYGGSGYYLGFNPDPDLSARTILEVDDVSVRGRLTARELLIQKIRTTTGPIFVSSGGEAVTATDLGGGSWQLTFEEDHGFLEYDLIAAQAWTGAGVYRLEMTVTAVADTKTLTATLDNGWGDTPGSVLDAGLTLSLARHGNEVDPDRQGLIYLTSDEAGAPFIRVIDGIDSWAKWGDPTTIKMQMGQLEGVSHAVMGDLTGFGMVATGNAYMEGLVVSGNGDTVMGDDGLNIQAGTLSEAGWSNHSDKITFAEDPMATLDHGNVIAQIGAERFVSGSDVVRRIATRVNAGADSDTDQARIGLEAYWIDAEADVPIQSAAIQMIGEEGAPSISLRVQGSTANAGTITLDTPVLNVSGHIRMTAGGDIGTALDPVGTLYADELVVGTTYTNNTGFVNDIRYYPRTELNTYLDNTFEQLGHSHPGLVTSAALTDTLADYATIAYVDAEIAGIPAPDLSNYWTKAQADGRYTQATTYNGHVAAANPHGTALADLASKDYEDLDNRGHLLADATGLGPDHTISGAAIGYVLRATSATAARFMQPLYTDLGSRTHDIISEHSVTAAQYSVIGTPAAANTLAAWATTTNAQTNPGELLRGGTGGAITLGNTTMLALQATTGDFGSDVDIDGDLDITGTYAGLFGTIQGANDLNIYGDTIQFGTAAGLEHIVIDSAGSMRSLNYLASGGRIGWELAEGTQKLSNVFISGALSSTVIEYKSRIVGGGGQIWRPAGRLKTAATITGRVNLEVAPPSFPTVTLHLENPETGKIQIADVDDVLMVQAIAYESPPTTTSSANPGYIFPFIGSYAYADAQPVSRLTRFVVTAVTDEGDYYSYDCIVVHATGSNYAYPAGTGVVVDGNGIEVVADEPYSPRLAVYKLNQEFYDDDNTHQYYHDDIVILGRLDSKSYANPGEVGLTVHSPGGWGYGLESWIVASDDRVALNNTAITMTPWSSENNQLVIDPVRGISFYVDFDELAQFESESYPDADVFMALDWVDPNDDDRQLLRIDADTDGQRVIEANHTKREWYDDYYQETNYERKSRLLISSNSQDSDHFNAALANKSATLELEASHLYVVPDDEDGETSATTVSAATLTADWVGLRQNATVTIGGTIHSAKVTLENGFLKFVVPHSSTGLPVGAVWNDAGTLKIVTG